MGIFGRKASPKDEGPEKHWYYGTLTSTAQQAQLVLNRLLHCNKMPDEVVLLTPRGYPIPSLQYNGPVLLTLVYFSRGEQEFWSVAEELVLVGKKILGDPHAFSAVSQTPEN